MAVQPLVEQTVAFLSSDNSFDPNAILSNQLMKILASNSLGNDLLTTMEQYSHWDGNNWSTNWLFRIRCYVSTSFQATVQHNIGALQAAFPQYTVVTWGYAINYGS